MFDVQNSFVKKRMTAQSNDWWSAFVKKQTSSLYSNTGNHFVLIR